MGNHLGDKLDAFLDGSLAATERNFVQDHLKSCAVCKEELGSLKGLAESLEKVRPLETSQRNFQNYWHRLLGRHREVQTMSTIQRLKRVVESNIHAAIDAMEEPSKMIRQLLREMEDMIGSAREELVEAIVLEKSYEGRWRNASNNLGKWENRAILALKNGREELAREALREQLSFELLSDETKEEWEKQKNRVAELKSALMKLERQHEDLQRRKSLWIQQARNSLRQSRSRQLYQSTYNELLRMIEISRERSLVESTYAEVYTRENFEETLDGMEENELLEKRLIALKQRLENG
jgi:phage shock protein A